MARVKLNREVMVGGAGEHDGWVGAASAAHRAAFVQALLDAMDYIANNWKRIAEMIRDAGVVAGVAIKSAIVVGMTRHFVGSVMIAAGEVRNVFSTIKESAMPVAEFIGQQIKRAHMGLARGMKGGGSGIGSSGGREDCCAQAVPAMSKEANRKRRRRGFMDAIPTGRLLAGILQ